MFQALRIALMVLFVSLVIVACGGGGGGGGGSYSDPDPGKKPEEETGDPAPLVITPQNATQINAASLDAWSMISGFEQEVFAVIADTGLVLPGLTKALASSNLQTNAVSVRAVILNPAISVSGACDGSANGSIAIEDTGDFTGDINFSNFNNCDLTINGRMDISGTIDSSLSTTSMSFMVASLEIETATSASLIAGDIQVDGKINGVNQRSFTSVVNLVLSNNQEQGIRKMEDLELAYSEVDFMLEGNVELYETINGRVYFPGVLYVDIKQKLAGYRRLDAVFPYRGIIQYVGADSMQDVQFLDTSPQQFKSQLDVDGDGVFDNAGQCIWNQLCPLIIRDKFGDTASTTPTAVTSDDIINTGRGQLPGEPGNQWVFGNNSNFAGTFTLSQTTTIKSSYIWLALSIYNDFEFTLRVHDSIGGMPGNILYSKDVIAPVPLEYDPNRSYAGYGWYGWDNIDLTLAPGAYWVSFAPTGNSPHAIAAAPSQSPLTSYASINLANSPDWRAADYLRLGIIVEGQ